jgi:hypothetical protein
MNRQDFVMETPVQYLGECERLKALTSKTMSTTEFCDVTPSSVVTYRCLYSRVLKSSVNLQQAFHKAIILIVRMNFMLKTVYCEFSVPYLCIKELHDE